MATMAGDAARGTAAWFGTGADLRRGIVKRSVKELVGDKLASLIASGVLQVGDELPGERELAAAFDVSRETVRGAIQGLAARRIVEVSHGARTRVIDADVGPLASGFSSPRAADGYDIEAVHAARLLVERHVVGEAARRIDDEALRHLDAVLAAQEAAMDDPVRFLISDREFHVAIYRASGNPLLADFVTDLYSYMMDDRRRVMARPGAIARSYRDHVAIVAALRARDPDATVAAFGAHLDRIYTTPRSALRTAAKPPRRGTGRSKAGKPIPEVAPAE